MLQHLRIEPLHKKCSIIKVFFFFFHFVWLDFICLHRRARVKWLSKTAWGSLQKRMFWTERRDRWEAAHITPQPTLLCKGDIWIIRQRQQNLTALSLFFSQTCNRCKARRKCTKRFSIQKFPQILVLRILCSRLHTPSCLFRAYNTRMHFDDIDK